MIAQERIVPPSAEIPMDSTSGGIKKIELGTTKAPRPTPDDDEEDIDDPVNLYQCFICESECDDVDETTGGRHKNCARCFPCSLCDKCKIHLPKEAFDDLSRQGVKAYRSRSPERAEWPVCFYCLKGSDLLFMKCIDLSPEQRFRLSILNSDFSSRLSDI